MNSRMKEHIPDHCILVSFMGGDPIFFHLTHLSEAYIAKHVRPDLAVYSLNLLHNLMPTLKQWCIEYNLLYVEFNLRFSCNDLKYQTKRIIEVKKVDQELIDYLNNKST